jgi:5-hydroxyisourate hydrolase-like protein (transthyretin family)
MARQVAAVVGVLALMTGASAYAQSLPDPAGGVGPAVVQAPPQRPGTIVEGPPRELAPTKPGTATIRGHVLAADSGLPLRKAQVRLNSVDEDRPPGRFENQLTTTDAAGAYEFGKLSAGRYKLTAMKGGYVSFEYGQRRPAESGKPIEVVADQVLEKIDFALPRGAVITGRVVDEFGEPSANVHVAPMRYQFDDRGRRRLIPAGGATTNDLGEFRIFALAPGDYYLSATFPGDFGESNDRAAYAPIYYPGTADVDLAERLTMTSGQTVTDLLLTLLPVRTVLVSGTAIDAEGRPMPGFLMAEPSRSRVAAMNGRTTLVQPDGSFRVGGLTPGEYRLVVRAIPMLGSSEAVTASAVVTVGVDDVTGVRVVAGKPVIASGKVVIREARAAQSLRPSALHVIAILDDEMTEFSHGDAPPTVNDDWTFRVTLPPGRARLHVFGTPPGWDVKVVRSGGVDVTDVGLDVKPTEDLTNIEIELTNRVTETTGLVTDDRGEPVKDYAVVIFARDRQKWGASSRWIRTARSDQDGRFKIGGLPSGEYFACAVDFLEPGQERDLEFLDRIQTLATRFALDEGETHMLKLKLHIASPDEIRQQD